MNPERRPRRLKNGCKWAFDLRQLEQRTIGMDRDTEPAIRRRSDLIGKHADVLGVKAAVGIGRRHTSLVLLRVGAGGDAQ